MNLSYNIIKVYTFITWWTNNIMQASQLHGSRPNGNETSLDDVVLIVQLFSPKLHQTYDNVSPAS